MEIYKDNLFVEMYSEHEGHLHGFKQLLHEGRTDFQHIEIVDTHEFGRCLLLDGKMQSSQADEYIYHELLVHPACISHPDPKRVLILGGGEGATLREVLRYPGVERVDMVEIDVQVLDFAKKHLSDWHQGAFEDSRVNIIIQDGRKYLENTKTRYDVIISDISDPGFEGPAYLLYTTQFYQIVSQHLSAYGVLAMQAGSSSVISGDIMASIYRTLSRVFKRVCCFESQIPSFDMPWGFCLASQELDPKQLSGETVDQRLQSRLPQVLRAYDGETHAGMFKLSKALRQMLDTCGRVIEDKQPIYTPL